MKRNHDISRTRPRPCAPTTSKFGQKYRVGLVCDGARQTFIGRGVGHLVFPIRFGCPPEVALLTLV